jgi:hypothetical protein
LVTGAAIALLGAGLAANTRVNVAYAAIECVQHLQHPLLKDESELRELQECERNARHTSMGLGYVALIFALAGVMAAVFGYVAGKQEVEKAWQQWTIVGAKSPNREKGIRE